MQRTIRFQRCSAPAALTIQTNHLRPPDVGTGVLVSIPGVVSREGEDYYGIYLGHGQSKTAYELISISQKRARFDGKVLKVAAKPDIEPSVCRKICQFGVMTSILYEAQGLDESTGKYFHSWIVDRCIPLDEVCRYDESRKDACSLAAFFCLLRAAEHGLFMSDCRFCNFGLMVTEDSTQHAVVVINLGSTCIAFGDPWAKSETRTRVIKKFWAHSREEKIYNKHQRLDACLEEAREWWSFWPYITRNARSSFSLWEEIRDTDVAQRARVNATSAFRIVRIVGQWTAAEKWDNAHAFLCYRAASSTEHMSAEEEEIIRELYDRMTLKRADEEHARNVVTFWARLSEYRRRRLQSREDKPTTLIEGFKRNELWNELSPEQQQGGKWRSPANTILHNKAGWTQAARAIMKYGLPQLEERENPTDATEEIKALGHFVQNLAWWLKAFAADTLRYKQTPNYCKEYDASMVALDKRRRLGS